MPCAYWRVVAGSQRDVEDRAFTRTFEVPDDLRENRRFFTRTMIAAHEYAAQLASRADVRWQRVEYEWVD